MTSEKVKIALHVGADGTLPEYMKTYTAILDKNAIEYVIVDSSEPCFWESIKTVDIFIYRWAQYDHERQVANTILPIIENNFKIKCFPDELTSWLYDDKLRQQLLFQVRGLPIIPGSVVFDKKFAAKLVASVQLPVIFKLRNGAASENVSLVKTRSNLEALSNKMFTEGIKTKKIPGAVNIKNRSLLVRFSSILRSVALSLRYRLRLIPERSVNWQLEKDYLYLQHFLPGNPYDTRITVIGNRAFGFRRWARDGDFRASGSGKIDYDLAGIDLEFIKQAFAISKEMNFSCMAYDFLYGESGEALVCEISYTFMDKPVFDCPGYWTENMEFVSGHYWPAYCILSDLLPGHELRSVDENLF